MATEKELEIIRDHHTILFRNNLSAQCSQLTAIDFGFSVKAALMKQPYDFSQGYISSSSISNCCSFLP